MENQRIIKLPQWRYPTPVAQFNFICDKMDLNNLAFKENKINIEQFLIILEQCVYQLKKLLHFIEHPEKW